MGELIRKKETSALPSRKRPSRNSVAEWPGDFRSVILFVTIATEGRMPILDNAGAVAALTKAWRQFGNWRVGRWVVMPDHVHFFCAPAVFPTPDLQRWLSAVKSWTSREFPPELKERVFSRPNGRRRIFQMHVWDTQIRSDAHYSEKWEYTLRNPARKGFVARWEDWPWQGEENRLDWHD